MPKLTEQQIQSVQSELFKWLAERENTLSGHAEIRKRFKLAHKTANPTGEVGAIFRFCLQRDIPLQRYAMCRLMHSNKQARALRRLGWFWETQSCNSWTNGADYRHLSLTGAIIFATRSRDSWK